MTVSPYKIVHIRPGSLSADWRRVSEFAPFLSKWGRDKLREGLGDYVKSVLIEPDYICKDHRNLYSNFYSKKFHLSSPKTYRLHFFSETYTERELLFESEKGLKEYIGFSIVRDVQERCLGRTVIDPYRIGISIDNGNYLLRTRFTSKVFGKKFIVNGYPYTSQDLDATVCAHSALWGVSRYLSERYPEYGELYPYDLIQMTGDSNGRTVPHRGMTYTDYSSILSQFGCHPLVRLLQDRNAPQGEFRVSLPMIHNLYTYVESGFPVLASLKGGNFGHVVSIIGHTSDTTKSVAPDSEGYIDSASFVDKYIVVDDNCFPYQKLGAPDSDTNYGELYKSNGGESISIENMFAAVYPLPEKVYLPVQIARNKGRKFFSKAKQHFGDTTEPIVTRLFLTSGSTYKYRKLQTESYRQSQFGAFLGKLPLPHFIWVMEAGPLSQYLGHRGTGEVIMDATAGVVDDGLIYGTIGESLFFGGKMRKMDGLQESFPLFTHNLGTRD